MATMHRVIVHLKDGREIDLSGLSAETAIARLCELGVGPAQIAHTEHRLAKTLADLQRGTHGDPDSGQR
jgi:hypothetical protein